MIQDEVVLISHCLKKTNRLKPNPNSFAMQEVGSLDDEILECQLAILNTQMQLSQILTQTL